MLTMHILRPVPVPDGVKLKPKPRVSGRVSECRQDYMADARYVAAAVSVPAAAFAGRGQRRRPDRLSVLTAVHALLTSLSVWMYVEEMMRHGVWAQVWADRRAGRDPRAGESRLELVPPHPAPSAAFFLPPLPATSLAAVRDSSRARPRSQHVEITPRVQVSAPPADVPPSCSRPTRTPSHSQALIRKPLVTQCATSVVLFGTGDVLAQQAFEKKGANHDVRPPSPRVPPLHFLTSDAVDAHSAFVFLRWYVRVLFLPTGHLYGHFLPIVATPRSPACLPRIPASLTAHPTRRHLWPHPHKMAAVPQPHAVRLPHKGRRVQGLPRPVRLHSRCVAVASSNGLCTR